SASSVINLGSGVTVTNVTAADELNMHAELATISGTATGLRDLTVTTGAEEVTLSQAFSLEPAPAVVSVTPNVVSQGQVVDLVVEGRSTHFSTSSVSDAGDGVAVSGVIPVDATHILLHVVVGADTFIGNHNLFVATGAEVIGLTNALTVKPRPPTVFAPLYA